MFVDLLLLFSLFFRGSSKCSLSLVRHVVLRIVCSLFFSLVSFCQQNKYVCICVCMRSLRVKHHASYNLMADRKNMHISSTIINIGKPIDVYRRLSILLLNFLPADLPDGQAATRQKYISDWVLDVARKIDSDISHSLNLTGRDSESPIFSFDFRPQMSLSRPCFKKKQWM